MSKKLYPESDSSPINFEKLAVDSSEIDNHTGRIILPSSDMLDSLKEDDVHLSKKQTVEPSVVSQLVREDVEQAASEDSPSSSDSTMATTTTYDASVNPVYPAGIGVMRTLAVMCLIVGCLLVAALVWVGAELRLTRLSLEKQNESPVMVQASSSATANLESKEELSQLLLTAELLAAEFSETLKEVDKNVADIQKEVSSMEFEIVEPVEEEKEVTPITTK